MGAVGGIRYEASQSFHAGADIDAFRIREDGITLANLQRCDGRVSADYQEPRFAFCLEAACTGRVKIDPFEHKVRIADKKCALTGEATSSRRAVRSPCVRHDERAFNVQLALTAVVKQAEGSVAALLNLCNDKASADGVNGAGWNGDDFTDRNSPPNNKVSDRPIVRRRSQLLRRHLLLQAKGYFGARSSAQDVPRFSLSIRQTHRLCMHIVGMHLNRKRLAREQQFEKERWGGRRFAGPFVPDFSGRKPVISCPVPRHEVEDAPRPS